MDGNVKPLEMPGIGTTIHIADGVFTKMILIPTAGVFTQQEIHDYDHTTVLAYGSVAVWQDDSFRGVFTALAGIAIPAGTAHKFMATVDNTVLLCIHRLDRFDVGVP